MVLLLDNIAYSVEIKGNDLIRNILKTASLIALLPTLTLSSSANAAISYSNSWFEIEVILFRQIDDKSQLQEVFPETSVLPTPEHFIDLLGPYLSPNIAQLKNRIPSCTEFSNQKNTEFTLNPVEIQYQTFDEAMLEDIANNFYLFNNANYTKELSEITSLAPNTVIESVTDDTQGDRTNNTIDSTLLLSEPGIIEKDNDVQAAVEQIDHTLSTTDNLITLQEELTEQAREANTQQQYTFSSFDVPQEFCRVPEVFFDDYKKDHPYFSYNDVSLESTPLLFSGEEDLTTEQPYIINEASLQLNDIVKQLKRSRNFRPLLHMGWRQITRTKSEAIPLKLYAGENLMQPYYQALENYQDAVKQQQNNLLLEEQALIAQNVNNQLIDDNTTNSHEALQQQLLQNKISNILQQAQTTEPTIDNVLNSLNTSPNGVVNPISDLLMTGGENTLETPLIEPQKPPQSWTIDGFLKVEVDHFLHITADFNVINMSLAEQATQQLVSKEPITLKSIRFEQNKRVRSKEIHYFDHPYMGMIIQIRRHEQNQPEDEAE